MWSEPGIQDGREPRKCCGRPPMLRVRPKLVYPSVDGGEIMEIAYVQFECRKCREVGGLAIIESEALAMWNCR